MSARTVLGPLAHSNVSVHQTEERSEKHRFDSGDFDRGFALALGIGLQNAPGSLAVAVALCLMLLLDGWLG